MEISLDKLISLSGDSELIHYAFSDGVARITLKVDELDSCVVLSIPTDTVRAEDISELVENRRVDHLTCYLQLIELSQVLKTQHGFYVAPADFVALMKDVRREVSLAYGKKTTEASWLFRVVGSSTLFSCLVADKKAISWVEVEE